MKPNGHDGEVGMGRSPQSPVGAVRRIALHSPWQHEVMVMLPDHYHHEAGRAKPSSLLIQAVQRPAAMDGAGEHAGACCGRLCECVPSSTLAV
ncbi:hypothetical protein K6X08_11395, partial [Burkholderia contaminans]|nr:hypothetical protein [Burkholderia contaminans]